MSADRIAGPSLTLHRKIMLLTLLDWSTPRIAPFVSLSVLAVRAILRAPLVQAELERLQDKAARDPAFLTEEFAAITGMEYREAAALTGTADPKPDDETEGMTP
jgi:hypothetical protein